MRNRIGYAAAIAIPLLLPVWGNGEDWPIYGHDNRRSHVTGEALVMPLSEAWTYRSPVPPQTAWTAPAKWDAFAGNDGLQSMRNFDPAYFVTVVGERVFFGSSVDHAAHCLDAGTGKEQWIAFADSAVRLPPSIHEGRAYFGADDGFAYCVDAATGEEIWRSRASEKPVRLIPSNGKLISMWPVRTGVMIEGGAAIFAGSLFPWETSYLCSVDPVNGKRRFLQKQEGVTLQGAMLASAERLYAPQGRSVPLVFEKATGAKLGDVKGAGGVWCILTGDEELISMPQNQKSPEDTVKLTDTKKRESILSIAGANRMLAAGQTLFVHQRTTLKAIDRRSPKESLWQSPQAIPSALILAGKTVILGGNGFVKAIDSESGTDLWTAEVEGRVYGLAAASGKLFVSTDRGHIVCFGQKQD